MLTDADLSARRAQGAWLALALLTLANVSGFVDRQVLSLLVEPIRHDLSLTDTQVSLLMGLGFVVVSSTLALPMGRLADTRSRRGLLAAGKVYVATLTAQQASWDGPDAPPYRFGPPFYTADCITSTFTP